MTEAIPDWLCDCTDCIDAIESGTTACNEVGECLESQGRICKGCHIEIEAERDAEFEARKTQGLA